MCGCSACNGGSVKAIVKVDFRASIHFQTELKFAKPPLSYQQQAALLIT